jgi:hypothetical protein
MCKPVGSQGTSGAGVSRWICSCGGAWSDRNQNAAQNILVTVLIGNQPRSSESKRKVHARGAECR